MTDTRDVLEELGALLEVEPSPAFAANVRNAVDRGWPRRFGWRVMALAGLGVAVAGMIVASVVSHRGRVPGASVRMASNPAAPVREAPTALVSPGAAQGGMHAAPPRGRTRAAAENVVDLAPIVTTMDGVDVIVPSDQRLALARLVSGVRAGRFSVPAGLTQKYDADGLLLPLEPVLISAIPDPVPGPIDPPATESGPKGLQREKR